MSKNYRFLPDYILWEMSFANAGMYNAILPSYGDEVSEKEVGFDELESELADWD